jgi:hypothetical protein
MSQETKSRPAFSMQRYGADLISDWQDPMTEPTLDEILADPIVHLVLGRDHLEVREVEQFLKCASRRLIETKQSPNFGRVRLQCPDMMAGC